MSERALLYWCLRCYDDDDDTVWDGFMYDFDTRTLAVAYLSDGDTDASVAGLIPAEIMESARNVMRASGYVLHPIKNVWQHQTCAEYLPDREGVMRLRSSYQERPYGR